MLTSCDFHMDELTQTWILPQGCPSQQGRMVLEQTGHLFNHSFPSRLLGHTLPMPVHGARDSSEIDRVPFTARLGWQRTAEHPEAGREQGGAGRERRGCLGLPWGTLGRPGQRRGAHDLLGAVGGPTTKEGGDGKGPNSDPGCTVSEKLREELLGKAGDGSREGGADKGGGFASGTWEVTGPALGGWPGSE